jgi:hypothetical protein
MVGSMFVIGGEWDGWVWYRHAMPPERLSVDGQKKIYIVLAVCDSALRNESGLGILLAIMTARE